MGDFAYTPLASSQSIRLVQIASRAYTTELECQIFEHDLSSTSVPASSYTALSYCWGTLAKTSTITLNGRSFRVTKNLYAALEALRASCSLGLLWIDALCIDQSNVPERNSQVLRMRNIYEQASRVVIWLGAGSNETTAAMHWIETTFGSQNLPTAFTNETNKITLYDVYVKRAPELFDTSSPDGKVDFTPLQGLCQLLMNPWFERVWIIQEATTPKMDMFVYCGKIVIHWNTLVAAVKIITHLLWRPELQHLFASAPSFDNSSLRRLFNLDKQRKYEKPVTRFIQILAMYRHSKATDQRDKIYALRGLAADLSDDKIVPNYALQPRVVFAQVAEHLIITKRSFECLGFCDYTTRDEGYPSWVPSWSIHTVRHPLAKRQIHDCFEEEPPMYTAGIPPATTTTSSFNEERQWKCHVTRGLILNVAGFCVDFVETTARFEVPEVSTLSSQTSSSSPSSESPISFKGTPAIYGVEIPESQMYRASSETLAMAYSRTVVADIAKSGNIRTRGYNITLDYWRHVRQYTRPPTDHRYRKEWGSFMFSTTGRCLYWSRRGYLGLGPVDVKAGDRICVFFGGDVLYVLRPVEGGLSHFLGECYVHVLMDGEAFELLDKGSHDVEAFAII